MHTIVKLSHKIFTGHILLTKTDSQIYQNIYIQNNIVHLLHNDERGIKIYCPKKNMHVYYECIANGIYDFSGGINSHFFPKCNKLFMIPNDIQLLQISNQKQRNNFCIKLQEEILADFKILLLLYFRKLQQSSGDHDFI